MLNDHQASELLSKSMSGALDPDEEQKVSAHLESNSDSRAFARISLLIQSSLADIAVMAEDGDASIAPGLSADAKQRLKDSVRREIKSPDTGTGEGGDTVRHLNPDTALAWIVLKNALLHESRITELIQNWKPTGVGTFGQFLVNQAAITQDELESAESEAASMLSELEDDSMSVDSMLNQSAALSQVHMLSNRANRTDDSDTPASRQLVSRFSLVKKLGQGGLGTVWLAHDQKLKRNVAIKELNSTARQTQKSNLRFNREAEITGYLEHPNVVPLYQYGNDPKTGQPFYAMRFVGKRTLGEAIAEFHESRKLGADPGIELHKLLTAFLGVCQAIAYAHSKGVIHRDLKPENVALDNFGQVIVLDWGLAKLTDDSDFIIQSKSLDDQEESFLSRTMAGEVVGTPMYMSPEQASGNLDQVDERTDVYGLGAILFAILTGQAPHERNDIVSKGNEGIKEVLHSIATSDAPSPRSLVSIVPRDLEAICLRALARNRFARFAAAGELADEVQKWMAGQHEQQQKYDQMRMEGREVRASLQSSVRDLSVNNRFMSNLPPIQELIDIRNGVSEEDESTWRDRLTVIYRGLLRANRDFTGVGFCTVEGDKVSEIVRVERHSTDFANVRAVPLSLLKSREPCDFVRGVMNQKPDEVFINLFSSFCEPSEDNDDNRLCAGVPIFDQRTEQPFGYVWVECDFRLVLDNELRGRVQAAQQVFVLDQCRNIWIHNVRGSNEISDAVGQKAVDYANEFQEIIDELSQKKEYICETDRKVYATLVDLGLPKSNLIFVLCNEPICRK